MNELMIEGIQYEKLENQFWEMTRLEEDGQKELTRYLNSLYLVTHSSKSIYDHVEYQSHIEQQFTKDLDHNEHVKLFVKLPLWFKTETPLGHYNPDWAFVTHRDKKLYFVRETKSTKNLDELYKSEQANIKCGSEHFKAIGVNYGVITSLKEVNFKKNQTGF
jgi:type III restriction enzyme